MRNKQHNHMAMIVDDDPFIRKLLANFLCGICKTVELENADNLLAIYKNAMPDILFLDINLPNANGLDLLKKIKEIDSNSYVIIITGDSSTDNLSIALKNGAVGFMSKPITQKAVLRYIDRCPTIGSKSVARPDT